MARRKPPKGFIRGHSHGRLGLHRTGGNVYTRKGVKYKRTRGGFAPIPRHRPPPYDPLQPLTGKGLSQELRAASALKYGPQERQLASEGRISGVQQQRITDYYNQYLQQLGAAQNATAQAYRNAQSGIYNQANTAAGQDQAQIARQQAADQAGAAQRGAVSRPSPDAQGAAQARRSLDTAFGGMIATQGAAQTGYMGALRGAGAAGAVQAHQAESARQRQIQQAGRDLAGERGGYETDLRRQLRGEERTYALNRQAFGLDVAKQQELGRQHKAQEKNVRRGQNLVSRSKSLDRKLRARLKKIDARLGSQRISETHRHNLQSERTALINALRPRGKGGGGRGRSGGGITPSQARSYRDKWEGYVGNLRTKQKPPKGVNPLLARAAKEYVQRGYVSYGTYKKIVRRFGFHPPTRKPKPTRHGFGNRAPRT